MILLTSLTNSLSAAALTSSVVIDTFIFVAAHAGQQIVHGRFIDGHATAAIRNGTAAVEQIQGLLEFALRTDLIDQPVLGKILLTTREAWIRSGSVVSIINPSWVSSIGTQWLLSTYSRLQVFQQFSGLEAVPR